MMMMIIIIIPRYERNLRSEPERYVFKLSVSRKQVDSVNFLLLSVFSSVQYHERAEKRKRIL